MFIEQNLPDMTGAELCRALTASEAVSPAAAFIVMSSGPVRYEQRMEVLRAGAWDLIALPVDAEELVLRLDRYVRAKLESDRFHDATMVDPDTGLYTRVGVLQRAQELAAAAARYGRPIACIVLETGEADDTPENRALLGEIGRALRSSTRRSDILGQIGPRQFAILAPDTPEQGARVVAERLRRSADSPASAFRGHPRAGVFALSDFDRASLDADMFVRRAAEVLSSDSGARLN